MWGLAHVHPPDTHLLGKTRVMPPSVAAKTARRLYLRGELGMPGISGTLLCPCPIPIVHLTP